MTAAMADDDHDAFLTVRRRRPIISPSRNRNAGPAHLLDSRGTIAVIPNKSNRKRIFPFDAERYKWRNLIERTNCRLKDFRAIATRYDKLARNFLAGLCLVTALLYWCD